MAYKMTHLSNTHPVVQGCCESWTFLHVGFEELVSKMLGEESEHKIGTLRIWDELPPEKQFLRQHLHIWQLFLTYQNRRGILSEFKLQPKGVTVN